MHIFSYYNFNNVLETKFNKTKTTEPHTFILISLECIGISEKQRISVVVKYETR